MTQGQQDLKCSAKVQCKTYSMNNIKCNTNILNIHSSITSRLVSLVRSQPLQCHFCGKGINEPGNVC